MDYTDYLFNLKNQLENKNANSLWEEFNPVNQRIRYPNLYDFVADENLRDIFSILHWEINKLFRYLNSRLVSAHFTAHESRELLHYISTIREAQRNLKGTDIEFELIPKYQDILDRCEGFLQHSGGSPIPSDFKSIETVEIKPIFIFPQVINLSKNDRSEKLTMIGEGSYAIVYKFKDSDYDKSFALKSAKKNLKDKELVRFRNEFLEMKKLSSPYIVEVYQYDEVKNQYKMEYVDTTLKDYISDHNGTLDVKERRNIVKQLYNAFVYLHSKGLYHRDISFTNILLKKYDSMVVVKVSDFGLLKSSDSNLTSASTLFKGSLNDPSLKRTGFNNYKVCHEVYALTQVVFYVMTGKTKIFDFLKKHKGKNDFVKFLEKGVSERLDERYESVEKMRTAFNQLKNIDFNI